MRRTTLLTALALLLAPASLQAQWAKKYSIFCDGNNLAGVASGTADNAVAVGALSDGQGGTKPVLLYTIDRGENWAEAPAPSQFSLIISVSMPDANTVYGAGLGLYKSTSGGSSYAAVSIPGTSLFTGFTQVDAFSAAHAAAVSGSDVYRTHSGQAWDATKTGMDAELNAVFMLDAGRLWIAGGKVENITETDPYTGEEVIVDVKVLPNGLVMSSTDGGKTFEPLVMGAPEVYYHLAFANELIGLAV